MELAILDSNVIFSGLKSRTGSSFRLLEALAQNQFRIAISVPLILEYESVLTRELDRNIFSEQDIKEFLDYLCTVGVAARIYYLWRPILKDPKDDHILEVAVAASCRYIVTYNIKHFQEARTFGIEVVQPYEFLKTIGGEA